MVRRERGEDTFGVVEGILGTADQLGFGFSRIVPAFSQLSGFAQYYKKYSKVYQSSC
jgi:hypothetical protein